MTVPNTDPLAQPAGVSEISPETIKPQEVPITNTEEADSATIEDSERITTELDVTEGQAQAQPVAGEAAVYEPAGDEDDDLIEGGEEYEEGDYDDEIDPDAVSEAEVGGDIEGAGEGLVGEGEVAGDVADADEGEEVGEGEDEDPYGVDGFVNGLDGNADEGGVIEEEEVEYEEYEDEADPETGAEGEGMSLLP